MARAADLLPVILPRIACHPQDVPVLCAMQICVQAYFLNWTRAVDQDVLILVTVLHEPKVSGNRWFSSVPPLQRKAKMLPAVGRQQCPVFRMSLRLNEL